MLNKKVILFVGLTFLMACGSDTESGEESELPPVLNALSIPLTGLSLNSETSFERHLKNGIYLRSTQGDLFTYSEALDNSAASNDKSSYSTTNVQEQGVDEADRIKYDGEHLFIAHQITKMDTNDEVGDATSIRIMRRGNESQLTQVSHINVNQTANDIAGIYLNQNKLAVLSNSYHYGIANNNTFAYDSFFPVEQKFHLSLVSVEDITKPIVNDSLTIDGALIDSRRIGNILYLISSYSASITDLPYATTDAEKLANYNTIIQTDITSLLPQYTDISGVTRNLVSADNCYVPDTATDKDGFDGLVTLTTIDLTEPNKMQSVCINSQIQGLYATPSSIYLYGTEYEFINEKSVETSVIHKFSVEAQQINYQASGLLDGRFNWSLSNLRFSEQNGYLRVVTTSGNNSEGYLHKVNVLSQLDTKLKLVSQLPNDINPQLIGKIDEDGKVYEDIKAVRFFDNEAYIVTFLNTDPLYVVNLTNNLAPVISGELEIPGYSAYLHPLSESLLLGVGQNIDPNRLNILESGEENESPIIEGAKVSLFDISDISAPREVNSIVYENGYTPVEFDYHALTSLAMNNGSHRLALPVERWLSTSVIDENQQQSDVWYPIHELALLEVTTSDNQAELVNKGSIQIRQDTNDISYTSGWDDRALFHFDDVYYIHGHQVWQSNWLSIEGVTGPF